jgi:hypothetical protein
MNPTFAAYTIGQLRTLSVADADHALCAMHRDDLFALGDALGLRLPTFGGDKPALIGAALRREAGR